MLSKRLKIPTIIVFSHNEETFNLLTKELNVAKSDTGISGLNFSWVFKDLLSGIRLSLYVNR